MDKNENQYQNNQRGEGAPGGQSRSGEGAAGGQNTSGFQSQNYSQNYNQNGNLGDSIRNLVQSTLDSIDYGGIGAGINHAVNNGMEQARVQMERARAREQAKMQRNQTGASDRNWSGAGNYNDLYQNNHRTRSVSTKNQYKQIYPTTVVSHSPTGNVAGVLLEVFGGVGTGAAGICSIVFGALFLSGVWSGALVAMEISVPILLGSFAMIKSGSFLRRRVKQFRQYVNALNGKRYGEIKELSQQSGRPVKGVVKDLKKMIRLGMFPQAHLDDDEKTLMLDQEIYDQYLEMKEHQEETEREDNTVDRKEKGELTQEEKLINEGRLYMEQIKSANDAILGEEISKKLERLETVTGKIFQYVAKHPDKTDEIHKFMEYYMPTTLKLVFAYKEFDAQPIQGENILSAKAEIEHSLDMVNQAFENLFDGLFQEEAMDISSDISVLQTMLKQEGLTGSDFEQKK